MDIKIVHDYKDLFYMADNYAHPENALSATSIKPPTHEVHIANIPRFANFPTFYRILSAAHYTVGDKHITERKERPDYQLLLTTGGEGRVFYNNKEYILTPNSALLVDCRKPHKYTVNPGNFWEYKHIHFQTEYPEAQIYSVPDFQENCTEANNFFDKLINYSVSLNSGGNIALFIYSNLIDNILTSIIEENYNSTVNSTVLPQSTTTFFEIVNYIHNNYYRPLSISEIIKNFNYSESYFIRTFKKYYQTTPHQYIIQYRIGKVYERMAKGESVQSAALACGFNSSSSFYYAIKSQKSKQIPSKNKK